MKRISLIEGFQNMWVIYCIGASGGDSWWGREETRAHQEGGAPDPAPPALVARG